MTFPSSYSEGAGKNKSASLFKKNHPEPIMSPNIAGFGPSDQSRNPARVPMMTDEAISYGGPSLFSARLGAYHEATAERNIINAEIKKIPQSPRN